jgi:GT2 family glycosyltransferase
MTADSAITVAVSTRDRPVALDRCLASLVANCPTVVIVVDQSTADDTARLVDRHRASGLPIEYVKHGGAGLGASQNAAISRASSEFVAVVDDDCVASPDWLSSLERALASDELDLVGGRVLPMEPEGDRVHPVSSRTSTVRRRLGRGALPWLVGSGNNFLVRRELFLRIGGCDERLGPGSPLDGGVDIDLFHRLLGAGARALYEPDAIVYHERQTSAARRERRPMYGRGTGAAIAFWLRGGDWRALRVLLAWIWLRANLLFGALVRANGPAIREELVMLRSTIGGLVAGLSASRASKSRAPAS